MKIKYWLGKIHKQKTVSLCAISSGMQIIGLPYAACGLTCMYFNLQSLASMGSQPVKNLDDLMKQQTSKDMTSSKMRVPPGIDPVRFNPFIYGNDTDSVDIATRVAMVSFAAILAVSIKKFNISPFIVVKLK